MTKQSKGQLILKTVSAGMSILFVVWAYYQLNDLDSFQWVLVYGAGALASLLYIIGRLPAALPLALGSVCLIWAAYLSTQFTYAPPLILIEEWREMMGLLIIAIWMGLLIWNVRRAKTSPAHAGVTSSAGTNAS